jgi:cytochrome c oxidase subunit 2
MRKIIISLIAVLAVMEGLGWWAYKSFQKDDTAKPAQEKVQESPAQPVQVSSKQSSDSVAETPKQTTENKPDDIRSSVSSGDARSFPPPSVETVNGVVQRTIHMGVRQWAWDPSEIKVNYGERVILIMHNADVEHSISIPDLNVKADIPEEGAIVTFTADKRGTFDFFCNTPCGKGHSQMKGRITVS